MIGLKADHFSVAKINFFGLILKTAIKKPAIQSLAVRSFF